MKVYRILSYFCISILLLSSSILLARSVFINNNTADSMKDIAREITVNSDSGFNPDYWWGNGTAESPYILKSKMLYGYTILINNTHSHFIIRDLFIETHYSYYPSIRFHNVENALIVNCSIKPCDENIYTQYYVSDVICISISSSENISVEDCVVSEGVQGILISHSNNIQISNCQLTDNIDAICIDHSNDTQIRYNRIVDNENYGLKITEDSFESSIVENMFGYNGISQSWDDDLTSIWHSNYWDDYNESGVYQIPGNGSNYDDAPLKLTSDVTPPMIYHDPEHWKGPFTTLSLTRHPGALVPSYSILLSDTSQIDSAYVYETDYDQWHKLAYDSESDLYSYTSLDKYYSFWQYYYFWVNDSAGNIQVSRIYQFWFMGYTTTPPETTPPETTPQSSILPDSTMTLIILGSFVVIVLALSVYVWRFRIR